MKAFDLFLVCAAMVTAPAAVAEEDSCAVTSVEFDRNTQILNMTTTPANATVDYCITGEDAVPHSGPSGMTVTLTGRYLIEAEVYTVSAPKRFGALVEIRWEEPREVL